MGAAPAPGVLTAALCPGYCCAWHVDTCLSVWYLHRCAGPLVLSDAPRPEADSRPRKQISIKTCVGLATPLTPCCRFGAHAGDGQSHCYLGWIADRGLVAAGSQLDRGRIPARLLPDGRIAAGWQLGDVCRFMARPWLDQSDRRRMLARPRGGC